MLTLTAQPLTAAAFAPFGDIVALPTGDIVALPASDVVAQGNRRFDDLARIDTDAQGRPMVSLLAAGAVVTLPLDLTKLERHPLGSQAFIPCGGSGRLLVVVAPPGERPDLSALRAFVTDGRQGVNYLRGVWHSPIAALEPACFVVIDRHGPGANCDLVSLAETPVRVIPG